MAAIAVDRSLAPFAPSGARSAGRAGRPTTRPASPPWGRVAGPAPRPAAHRSTARVVYRRRRLVALLVVVAVAFLAGVFLTLVLAAPASGALTDEAQEARRVSYVVGPGDTMWAVARQVAPHDDPRNVVDALVAAHGSSGLVPGDVIVWPPR